MKSQDPMKPQGTWEVRRRIGIPALVHAADALTVERHLNALAGVRKALGDMARRRVEVRYDASEVDYRTVAQRLEAIGFPPDDGRWSRFKGGLFQFLDTNARNNAHAPPPACCNKPPRTATRSRRR